MKVWVVMFGKDEPGMASIHANLASAYGAARKCMEEVEEYDDLQEWGPSPNFFGTKDVRDPFNWSTPGLLYSCWIETREVLGVPL
jgi:hypothetical protein